MLAIENANVARRRWKRWARLLLIAFAIWTLLGVFLGYQYYVNYLGSGQPRLLTHTLKVALARYWIYGLLSLPLFWLVRRWPLRTGSLRPAIVAHIPGIAAFMLLHPLLRMVAASAFIPATGEPVSVGLETFLSLLRSNFFDTFFMYFTIAGVAHAFHYYRDLRHREIQEAEFKAQIAEYELKLLKTQLHPHFLFNTLQGISVLIGKDPEAAREMLTRLGDLLRIALEHAEKKRVALREELKLVETYLDIEKMRLCERLKVEMNIDPATLDARVPHMLLQPLVENSIRHGIAAMTEGGLVRLSSRINHGALRLTIVNDGPPAPLRNGRRRGLGLGNTRALLQQLYGAKFVLELKDLSNGAELVLEIPFESHRQDDLGSPL